MIELDQLDSVSDVPSRSDQYLHVTTHAWWMAGFGLHDREFRFLGENWIHVWIPADRGRAWLLERRVTGRQRWLAGSAEEAVALGFEVTGGWPSGRWRAPFGDFFARESGRRPSAQPGSWAQPDEGFLAELPRDPHELYQRLENDSPRNRPGYIGALKYALAALKTGLVPADLRGALYGAIGLIPGAAIIRDTANVDGAPAVALAVDDGTRRTDVLIDPSNGEFVGERVTMTSDAFGLRAGVVTSQTAMRRSVVDELPEPPG